MCWGQNNEVRFWNITSLAYVLRKLLKDKLSKNKEMNQERRQHGLQQTENTTQKKGEWDTYDNDNFTLEEEDKRKHPSLNIWTSGMECGVALTAQKKKKAKQEKDKY